MRFHCQLAAIAIASAVALIGCDRSRPSPLPADPSVGCVSCHGGQENQTAAPPYSLPRDAAGDIMASGNRYTASDNTTRIEVGAHTRHMARGVSCGACHVVPSHLTSPGHNIASRATVTFKEVAAAGNVIPSNWVPRTHTCTNYCHGSSLGHGGTNHTPNWLGGTAAGACGTCHFAAGVAPPAQHPSGPGAGGAFADTKACAVCHTETVDAATGDIRVDEHKHVNGRLDGGAGHPDGWEDPANHGPAGSGGLPGCATCHGTDFGGGTAGVSCNDCHASNGHPNWQTECTFCHGSAGRAADATFPNVGSGTVVRANLAAPPAGSQGENAITAYAVGAHEAHVGGGPNARPAQCTECHGPTLPADVAHVNGTVVIGWGATATRGGAVPVPAAGNLSRWNDTTLPANGANCTNFCHGATLAGGSHTSPKWNEGAAGAACGSCHAIPLPYTAAGRWHVPRTDCNSCHPGYTSTSVNITDHVFVGAGPAGLTCHSCHGSSSNDAPPGDTTGATAGNRVGAHQKHVATLTLHQGGFTCTECHPNNSGNNTHATGSINILWGATAAAGGYAVTPVSGGFTPGAAFPTCTNYCHLPRAADTAAGLVKAPSWTATGNIVCGSCHGLPPVTTAHPANASGCSTCHDGYADAPGAASTASAVSLANHINGVVDVKTMSCTACHGTTGRVSVAGADPQQAVAPPIAASNTLAVGAHLAHVNQGSSPPLSPPFACIACHNGLIPTVAPHSAPANPVAWGGLAVAGGAAPPAYALTTQTCSSTYCHGQFTGGKAANAITWNAAGKLACNGCHGQSAAAPQPGYPHPQNSTCATCHSGYTSTAVTSATHVDGAVTKSTAGCTACHGDRADAAVTPTVNLVKAAPGATGTATTADTTGATATTAAGVGAHRAHLVGSTGTPRWRTTALACTECHAVPATATDTAHASGAGTGGALATMSWGPLAAGTAFGARTPGYTRPSCASTYCHSPRADTTSGLNQAPSWVAASTTVACGSCHGLPPVAGSHVANTACSTCHAGYANAPTSASTISAVNATAHMNGTLDVIGQSCTSCHGDATRTPVATATDLDALGASLVKAAPPNDSTGLAASALVGAHLAHVNQGATTPAMSSALKCINCHSGLVPTAAPHSVPANPVAWGNLATARGAVPTTYATANRNCSSTYCHGQFSPYGKTGNTVNWGTGTSAKLACNGCHGQSVAAPQPGYPHPQNTTCASCHTGYTSTTAAAATHVDGLTTKSTTGCTACHGDRADTAVTLTTNTFKAAPGATGATTTADTTGATTGASVGAHRAHLVGSTGTPRWRTTALTCTECHALPASNTDVTHATGTGTGGARATLTWGILAADTAFGARTPTYTQPTCAATYCHSPRADTTAGLNQTPSWTGATTTVVCGSCHGLPPVAGSHPANTACSTCHTGYANAPTSASTITAVNATTHMNGVLDAAGGDCVGCHATAQTMAAGGTRRAIVPEFALAWSHKRSGGGTVTKFDCVVCHMEGDATGNTTAVHQDGVINLRDPDTGLNIKGVTFAQTGATDPGSYTSTTADLTFTRFSRNLASATLEPAVQAIMINQCLKCHDANGALSPLARVPTTGTAEKPFGTTIAGTGYTGAGVTANGVLGGVADVAASFNTANASYHPVRGKQNNSYVGNLRLNAPWNTLTPAKTPGTINATNSWGFLISCWDCHAPLGTASTVTLTATVTAHGGATTLRQAHWVVNATNLCTVCHLVVPVTGSSTSNHGAGSAFGSGGHSGPGGIARTSCYRCHGSLDAGKPARPISAQDVHGFDAFASTAGTGDTMWPVGTSNTYKPYGFMRSAGSASGMWKTTSWKPLSGPGVPTGSATCGGSASLGSGCGTENHSTYTPGGSY